MVSISDDPHRFDAGARLIHVDGRELVVESARAHRNRFLVKFAGVDSRESAQEIKGALYVPSSEARSLEDDEFWEHDLTGCTVTLVDGTEVGPVGSVVHGPAQDLLVVITARGERSVPVVGAIVTSVDLAARRIVIDPPEGLLD